MNTSCLFFLAIVAVIYSAEVIFERSEVYDVNPKFLANVSVFVKRNSRRSPYFVHASATLLQTVGDNVTIHALFYEFLHNEYKRSFVEVTWKLCDLLYKEPWKRFFGTLLISRGVVCPAPPNTYNLSSITVSMDNFPAVVVPFEKFMVEGNAKLSSTQEVIARGRLYMHYKRDLPKGK